MGTRVSYDVAFDRVVGHEGGFQDDRDDRGNWTTGIIGKGELRGTKFGISAMSYPNLDIKNLTVEDAKAIYQRDFWSRAGADRYDAAIVFQLFDMGINHGFGNAIRMLQRAVGVADDGKVGPVTINRINATNVSDVIMLLNAERLVFITKISTFAKYGAGWVNRTARNLRYGAEDNGV